MYWKLKACVQNLAALLPAEVSFEAYYRLQRHCGSLRVVKPQSRLIAGIESWRNIMRQGQSPKGKVFFEVGTGRVPLVPLAYWLMGAEKTVTVDLNPYLKKELVIQHLRQIFQDKSETEELFGDLLDQARFAKLCDAVHRPGLSVEDFLSLCRIEYCAPANAAKTYLPDHSIDFHTSFAVFEHIPPMVLKDILAEGNRLMRRDGLFIHRIDYSDHFSHSDRAISAINFLQYSDVQWARYAGNRYMYMNRLRHDDFLALFSEACHDIVYVDAQVDERSKALLEAGEIKLDVRFRSKPHNTLAISGSWIVSRHRPT